MLTLQHVQETENISRKYYCQEPPDIYPSTNRESSVSDLFQSSRWLDVMTAYTWHVVARTTSQCHVWQAQSGLLTHHIKYSAFPLWGFLTFYHRNSPTSAVTPVRGGVCSCSCSGPTLCPRGVVVSANSRAPWLVASSLWSVSRAGLSRACSRMARAAPAVPTAAAGSGRPCPSARCPPPRHGWDASFRRDGLCLYPEWWWYSRPQGTPRNRAMPCPVRKLRRKIFESRPPPRRTWPWANRSAPRWTARSRTPVRR